MRGGPDLSPKTAAESCSWGVHEAPGAHTVLESIPGTRHIAGTQHIPGSAGLRGVPGAALAGWEPPSRTRSQRPSCRSLILLKPVVKILPSAMKMARMGRALSCGLAFSCAGR